MDIPRILDEAARTEARVDLMSMAIDVGLLIEDMKKDLALAEEHVREADRDGVALKALWYEFRRGGLEATIRKHRSTYRQIMDVVEIVDYADLKHLRSEIAFLRSDTAPWLGLNASRLPKSIRSRLDETLSQLA